MANKVSILGAGATGLAAGWRLSKKGCEVTVYDELPRVGGLAGGVLINGNIYEYGPHAFHTTDTEILSDIREVAKDDLIKFNRTITIKFLGSYFKYPLSIPDVILKLPPSTVIRAFLSLIWNMARSTLVRGEGKNSEEVLIQNYGTVLYKIFFKDYIERVWGMTPDEFSPNFAIQRIPRLNFVDLVGNVFSKIQNKTNNKTDNYVEKVEGELYTTKNGFSLIAERMADKIKENGGKVILSAKVVEMERNENRIKRIKFINQNNNEEIHDVDGVINTIPLNEAMLMVSPKLDGDIIEAGENIEFRSLVFVGLLVSRPKVLLSSFMYFREHSFNRITDLGQFGIDIMPNNATILVAEISCSKKDKYWQDDEYAISSVISDLEREDILKKDEIIESHVFKAEYAYPLYSLGYEKRLDSLLSAVESLKNCETAGRQGKFQYVNTHIAIKMGYEAADSLFEKMQRG